MESTKKEPEETIAEMQVLLKKHNIRDILISYDDNGEVSAMSFTIKTDNGTLPFRLPANHRPLWKMAEAGQTKYIRDEQQARRVAWRQVFRWVEAQLALIRIDMAKLEEIFLPYMMVNERQTVYDTYLDAGFNQLALPEKT